MATLWKLILALFERVDRFYHEAFLDRPISLYGVAVGRIVYGLWLLLFFLIPISIRYRIWGELGPISHSIFLKELATDGQYSLLAFSPSLYWIDFSLAIAVLSSLCVMLGLFTRTSLIVATVLLWSFHSRNHYILDGGDNLGRIVLLFLIFTSSDSKLSIKSYIKDRLSSQELSSPWANLFHNAAYYAIVIQLCIVYLSAGLNKISGQLWRNGTAIYYVMKNSTYGHPFWGPHITDSYLLVTAFTYFIVIIPVSYTHLTLPTNREV